MPVIKISYSHPTWPLLRQTPDNSGKWGDFTFVINQKIEECDGWVVINDLLHNREETKCPTKRTLFINLEPPTQALYPDEFLNQFSIIATCGGHEYKHTDIRYVFPLQPWYIGVIQKNLHQPDKNRSFTLDYDYLKKIKPPQKTKLISVVCTDKLFTEGHAKRNAFTKLLIRHFGEKIDVLGRGFKFISDKWEAIGEYKYHIAIENSQFPHYWTEKLADAFLGWAYPIYYGCPNIADYFETDSMTTIDIDKPDEAIEKIEGVLAKGVWEDKLEAIAEARRRILDEYNLFPMILKLLNLPDNAEKKELIRFRSVAHIVGLTRMFLRRTRAKLQFGLGITKIFPFLRKI